MARLLLTICGTIVMGYPWQANDKMTSLFGDSLSPRRKTIEPSRQNLIIPGPLLGLIGSLGAMVPSGQAENQPENLISTHLAQ